ncbi:MAG: methyl-accepting chemotaxis protein [Negativicutes bacterium]|nr:methyl-accepting chemotaxis protein [Negativicutes bacterium]MDR3591228.1 methyl-accepting chemotaxis protein [Negativicutes bacterium]
MKKRLIAIFMIIGCIPLLVASLYFYNQIYAITMAENTLESEKKLAASKAVIQNVVQDRLLMLQVITKNPALGAMDVVGAKPVLVGIQAAYPELSFVLNGPVGNPLVRGDDVSLNYSVADRQYFRQAMSTGKEAISEVVMSRTTGRPILIIGVPVLDGQKAVGVAQVSFELVNLGTYVKSVSNDNTIVYIVDKEGKMLAHPDANIAKERMDMGQLDFVQRGLKGEAGQVSGVNKQGQETIVNYTPDEITGWVICSETPKSVVMAGLHKMTIFIAVGIVLLVAVIFAVGLLLSSKVAKPIILLSESVGKVAGGDLSLQELNFTTKDEIGELGRAFDLMTGNLRTLVRQVASSAQQIAASSEELTAHAEQSAQAATQVATSVGDTAQGVEHQAGFVDRSLAGVENIAAGTGNEAGKTRHVVDIANRAVEAAAAGNKAVDTAVSQMNSIRQTVDNSAHVVAELGEHSKAIGQIVETIAGIAGQTNLLALNAAIEAARAGEQGRGFAVVAEEVRKLAEQSQESAQQIAALINDIQSKTENAVQAMADGTQEVRRGSEVVNQAGKSFQDIDALIKEVASIAQEAADGINRLTSSSQDVLAAMRETGQISRNISNQTQTISAATQEQSAAMEEVASSSQYLAQLAEQLQQAVGRFKI